LRFLIFLQRFVVDELKGSLARNLWNDKVVICVKPTIRENVREKPDYPCTADSLMDE
jgi:hypothetical protein